MPHKIRFGSRELHLPRSRVVRVGLGILLVAGGLVGFLPVVGFWMIPLGLFVLSVDLPMVRRWRRRLALWWHRGRNTGRDTTPAGERVGTEEKSE
jgi:hypothetical protein